MSRFLFFILVLLIPKSWASNDPNSESASGLESTQKVLVYWDTSLSMVNRNLEQEYVILSSFFKAKGNVEVGFAPFDIALGSVSQFRVVDGDWSSLRSAISDLTYDGVALYKSLNLDKEADVVLIFSDGVGVLDDLDLPDGKDVYLINSLPGSQVLNRRTDHMNYLDISELGTSGVLSRLGVEDDSVSVSDSESSTTEDSKDMLLISGVVFDRSKPLDNVTILVQGEERGAVSGRDGRFELEASLGDVLVLGYLGMQSQQYRITGDQFIEFYLDTESNQLDEVVLKSNLDSGESKNTITTAYGEKNEDQIGYTIQTVDDEAFEGQANISDATRGKIISYNYSQNDDLSQIQLRQVQTLAAGTTNPLIVVDDVPLGVNDSSTGTLTLSTWHIDPNNVEKITVLRGLAATNKYGTLARGGAILIYTKTRAGAKPGEKGKTNSAMLRGNIYNETVTSVKTTPAGEYLKAYKKSKSFEEAYALYLEQREAYLGDFNYFVEVSKYMMKWGKPDTWKKILLNTLELNPGRVGHLRYVGMVSKDRKDYAMAQGIYEYVLLLAPQESQSYRDLALVLGDNHQYQKALDMYLKIKEDAYPGVNFSGLKKPLNSEMKRLILLHRNKLNTQGLPSHYMTPLNYDVRVVVDYNDIDAEFDLQFVNPQKKFFVWSHREFENASRFEQERAQGFNTEEFFLIDAEPGKWQINIECPEQDYRGPLALRYTVFRNYGTKNETQESKTLVLNNIEGKYLLGIIKI